MLRPIALGLVLALLVALPATAQDFQKGWAAQNRGDYATALKEWQPLAEQGDAIAQFDLGFMYANGQGVPQDHAEAIKLYRKAAEQGLASAQNNLGLMYEKGRGVPQDDATARKWYRKAAEQGYAHARHNLKLMDKKGRGAAKKAVPATARGGFSVQLGSGKSKAGAVDESVRLTQAHKLALNGLKIVLVRAELGKRGVFYRLRAGPLSDRAAANALCRKLSARKQGCIVIKH
jgi:TPR repeat protein